MEIQIVHDSADISACMTLRRIVFTEEQGVSEQEDVDGQDAQCTHVIAKSDETPVGAARFQYVSDAAKIQRVCVPKEFRGKGYGARIIEFIIVQVRTEGQVRYVRLGAQTHALKFYEKLGFRAYGPEYLDANIPHKDMEMTL